MFFNFSKYTIIILLFSLIAVTGCKDKLIEEFEGDFEFKVINGNGQSGIFNGVLSDSITVEVTHPNGTKPSGYKIIASTDFGRIIDNFKTTENGLASFEWELGCGEEQKINFSLYGTECDLFSIDIGACVTLDSVVGVANAIQETGWVEGCGLPDVDFLDLQFEETNLGLFLLVEGMVYRSVDEGLSWIEIPRPASTSVTNPHFVAIKFNPTDGGLHAVLNDHMQYSISIGSSNIASWEIESFQGQVNLNSKLGGYTIVNNISFAAFGSDGIFWDLTGQWEPISQTISIDEQFYKLESINNRVFAVYGSITEQHLLYNTFDDIFTEWESTELPADFFTAFFGDFLMLPNETAAIGSGIDSNLSEFDPFTLTGTFTENIQNNSLTSFGKSIKDLVFYNDEIYFLGFDKNFIGARGSIWKGENGNFEELDFDGPCNNITFFDIQNDGSFIVGCENGLFVFKG